MLLDHLADPLARNSNGLTPREYLYYVERFTGEQNTEIEELLHSTCQIFSFLFICVTYDAFFHYRKRNVLS